MVIKKKKKKKEEFDASLMGGYLPGAHPVLSPRIVARTPDVLQINRTPRTPPSTVSFLEMSFPERLNYQIQTLGLAWLYYAIGSGPTQFAIQTPQAYGAYRIGIYPSFRVALAMELGVATALFATLGTILDPHRVWRAPFTSTLDPFPTLQQSRARELDIWNPGMAPGEWIRAGSTV